ncbi:MAG: glycosyltransferase family 2 protein [Anaerohalosphaera sp.]|nr:glycosyltransferase family 2 protein [Anaerohalosphaera sp.]
MPKVSVIIPTYNRANVVVQAINSVLSQTVQDVEVLLIDDGSSDSTFAVVESIGDGRIRYFKKPNGGAASARNLGLTKVSGQYLAFLDSDDYWPDNYIEKMLECLENNKDFGGVYSPITMIYSDGRTIRSYKKPEGKTGSITKYLFIRGFIWPSACFFRSEVWDGFYFDETLRSSEDSDAFLRLSPNCWFGFVDSVESFHVVSVDSLSFQEGISCNRLLVLERFYFKLGGKEIIPAVTARRRLSYSCRRVAEHYRRSFAKKAALTLYLRGLRYWPFDLRQYVGIARALLQKKPANGQPVIEVPEALEDIHSSPSSSPDEAQ